MPDNAENVLYYGDNLDVLRRHVVDRQRQKPKVISRNLLPFDGE